MAWDEGTYQLRPAAPADWEAALLEFEHQAEHWDTPDHRETGHLIASALRAAVDIARDGGLRCEHRRGSLPVAGVVDGGGARDTARVSRSDGDQRHAPVF